MKELEYFKMTAWYSWVLVILGFVSMIMGVFWPAAVPYSMLGPVGSFLYYINYSQQTLLRLILVAASAVHVGEGTYAYILTRRMNMTSWCTFLWTAQTTALGFTSLLPLRAKYLKLKKKE